MPIGLETSNRTTTGLLATGHPTRPGLDVGLTPMRVPAPTPGVTANCALAAPIVKAINAKAMSVSRPVDFLGFGAIVQSEVTSPSVTVAHISRRPFCACIYDDLLL